MRTRITGPATARRTALLACLAYLGLYSGPGAALMVNIGSLGQTYDVTSLPRDPFASNQALLTSQVWWGNYALAREFANAVNTGLGLPNISGGAYGPLFAYSIFNNTNPIDAISWYGASATDVSADKYSTFVYATAVHTPAPLPILGAIAAFAWSRRLRRRIQAARTAAA